MEHGALVARLEDELKAAASPLLAHSLQRYFPEPVAALGVGNGAVAQLASRTMAAFPQLGLEDWMKVADHFARARAYHEYFMLASALMARVARTARPPIQEQRLVDAMARWLEHEVSNWAQCDDLCIKPLYLCLQREPQLLGKIVEWGAAAGPWSRRASNVALVKFVGRSHYLHLGEVFANCVRLLPDPDPYVQKGIGWVLKVASQYEPAAVLDFVRQHGPAMPRPTLRYAIEKFSPALRASVAAAI